MRGKKILKRVLASVLAVVIVFNTVLTNVSAGWTDSSVELSKTEELKTTLNEVLEKLSISSNVKVETSYTLIHEEYGVNKLVNVEVEQDKLYHLTVGGTVYNSKDNADQQFTMPTSDLNVYKGSAKYEFTVDSQWLEEYNRLVSAADTAKADLESAKSALAEAEAKLAEAEADVTDKQKAYDEAVDSYNSAEADYNQKVERLESLEKILADLEPAFTSAEKSLNEAKQKLQELKDEGANSVKIWAQERAVNIAQGTYDLLAPGYNSAKADVDAQKKELEESGIEGIKAERETAMNAAKKALDDAQALVAEGSELKNAAAEATIAVTNKEAAFTAAKKALTDYAETLEVQHLTPVYKSYVAEDTALAGTVSVNVYNVLTVKGDHFTVQGHNGKAGTDGFKVYESNSSVVLSFDKVANHSVSIDVDGADKTSDINSSGEKYTYNVGALTSDKTIIVTYTEYGKALINIAPLGEGIEAVAVTNNGVTVNDKDSVYVGDEIQIAVTPKAGYAVDKVYNNEGSLVTAAGGVYKFTVAENVASYTISATAVNLKSSVAVVKNDASYFEGAITATSGTVNGNNITDIMPDTKVTVTIPVKTNYAITKIDVVDIEDEVVDLEKGKVTFTTAAAKTAYTVNVTAKSLYNTIIDNIDRSVVEGDVVIKYTNKEGEDVDLDNVLPNSTIYVGFVLKSAYGFKEETTPALIVDHAAVTGAAGEYYFDTTDSETYQLALIAEGVVNTQSTVTLPLNLDGAKVIVKVDGTTVTPDENGVIKGVDLGSTVEVIVTPDEGNYVKSLLAGFAEASKAKMTPGLKNEKGVVTLTFSAMNADYLVSVEIAPIIVDNGEDVTVDYFDLVAKDFDKVKATIFGGFDAAPGLTPTDFTYEYLSGEITIDEIDLFLIKIPATTIPVWRSIEEKVPTNEELVTIAMDFLTGKLGISLGRLEDKVRELIEEAVAKINIGETFHSFGSVEEGEIGTEETVRLTFEGNDTYVKAQAERKVNVQDLRTEVDVDLNTEISVVFGSYTSNDEILAKLLEGKLGVNVSGVALGEKYNEMLSVKPILVGEDVGTYVVTVQMADTDYEYKDGTPATATVNVTKANAAVNMTENNVVKLEDWKSDVNDIYTIVPDVVIPDDVEHIRFSLGLLPKTLSEEGLDADLVAKVDIEKLVLDLGLSDSDLVNSLINEAIKKAVDLFPEEGMSISEFTKWAADLVESISQINPDTGVSNEVFKQLTDLIEQAANGIDVTIVLTNSDEKFVPSQNGIYAIGVVTTDSNYNTAYGLTYLVITAEVVDVEFIGDNVFGYDGTNKTMTAIATKNGEDITEYGQMFYYYAGVQSDGAPYYGTEGPVHAGMYAVTAVYLQNKLAPRGVSVDLTNLASVGFGVKDMVVLPSGEAIVSVEDFKHVVYNEDDPQPVEIADMIKSYPADAKVAVITAGIDIQGDFSEEGASDLMGTINIDFPEKADEILKKLIPSAYTDGIDVKDFAGKLVEIQTKLHDLGYTNVEMQALIDALGELPNQGKVTFKNTYNGTIDKSALPQNIGAHLVVAVIFDPDYVPEAGAGLVFITPEIVTEELEWTYNDMNGVITQPVLDKVDLGADAVTDANNTKDIKYIFVGLTKDGKVSVTKADESNITAVSKGLRNGAYTQVAYLWGGIDAKMAVAEPIIRAFVHVPQQVIVHFNADGNDADPQDIRKFTYIGSPIEMPVGVEKLDGSEVKEECLAVYYTGVDVLGNVLEGSQAAPTNVGIYTVTAVYKEYDTVDSASLKYAGINVGTLVIEKAQAVVNIDVKDVECTCGCDDVTCGKCVECTGTAVDVRGGITSSAGTEIVTVVVDENGNANILLPENWGVESYSTNNKPAKALEKLIKKLEKVYEATNNENVANAITELKTVLDQVDNIKTIAVNGETIYECGDYTVYAFAFGPNYIPATAKGDFNVYPPEHVHNFNILNSDEEGHWYECETECCDAATEKEPHKGGTATCQDPKVCEVCGVTYGDKDPENHVGHKELRGYKAPTEKEDGYSGDYIWMCCGAVAEYGYKLPATGKDDTTQTPDTNGTPDNNGVAAPGTNAVPATGDTFNVTAWLTMAVVSACAFVVLLFLRKKEQE